MEVFWIGQNGSIQDAYWYEGANWQHFELAPAGNASTNGSISVVSRIPNSMEVFWIGQNGSVQDAYWYEGSNWQRFELTPAGNASTNGSISVVSRIPNSMEVFWIGQNGSVQDAYWYDQQVYHPRKVNWAIVLCKPVDDSSELQPKEFFIDLFHGVSNGSIRDYYAELTNNQIDFSGTDIIGWYTLKYKKTELTNYDADGNGIGTVYDRTTNIRLACEDVAQNYGVDFRKYSGVIVIYNYQLGDGGAWGIGASETMNLNGSVQNYSKILFDSAAWGNLDRNRKVISADAWSHTFVAHEVGHGLGIDHSRGSNNNDYGDPFDIMSAMTVSSYFDNRQFGQSGPGLNAPNLILLNAIHPFNFINYFSFPKNNSDILSETIKLYPTNSYIHVVKICKILNIDNTFYTIEFRMKTGWDENIDTSLFLHFVSVDNRNSLIGRCGLGETISKDHVQIKFLSIDGSTSNVEISGVYR